jgi:hypothetical protein
MDRTKMPGKNRGAILIITFLAVTVLVIISIGMFLRMLSETRATERRKETAEAFYLAEAAIDKAVSKLPSNMAAETGIPLGSGKYSLTITVLETGKKWKALGEGYVPDLPPNARSQKRIEAFLEKKDLVDLFWDNAIYSAGDVTFIGNSYEVDGKVVYADQIQGESRIPADQITYEPDISPLALLDFQYLRQIAVSQIKPDGQNNLYTAADIGTKAFPASFWFNEVAGIPNVVYVESDLVLKGNLVAGGFIIVGGDVIENVELGGNASIDGCVYTRGYFQNKGGGNSLNVNGGIWAGDFCTLRGNAKVKYNKTYMDAIRNNINPSTEVQLISWREE